MRARVGRARVVGCRFLGDDVIDGGSRVDDAAFFGVEFARAGLDFLSLSKGGKFEDAKQPKVGEAAYPYTGPSGYECMPTVISDERGPFGRNVAARRASPRGGARRRLRRRRSSPPAASPTSSRPRRILARGEADIVAAARQSLADPDWFRKIATRPRRRGPPLRASRTTARRSTSSTSR